VRRFPGLLPVAAILRQQAFLFYKICYYELIKIMIKKIAENKYVNAFLMLLLYSAVFHFCVLVYRVFAEKTFYPLNFFSILNLDVLFPDIFKNTITSDLISLLAVAMIYFFILKFQKA